jgi:hypothetical protein
LDADCRSAGRLEQIWWVQNLADCHCLTSTQECRPSRALEWVLQYTPTSNHFHCHQIWLVMAVQLWYRSVDYIEHMSGFCFAKHNHGSGCFHVHSLWTISLTLSFSGHGQSTSMQQCKPPMEDKWIVFGQKWWCWCVLSDPSCRNHFNMIPFELEY